MSPIKDPREKNDTGGKKKRCKRKKDEVLDSHSCDVMKSCSINVAVIR